MMMIKHSLTAVLVLFLAIIMMSGPGAPLDASAGEAMSTGQKCLDCHSKPNIMPGIYNQYLISKHHTAKVTCFECHKAQKDEPDAFEHYGELISVIVTPYDCGRCHPGETSGFNKSAHAKARDLVTTDCGRLFSRNLVNTQYPMSKGKKEVQSNRVAGSVTSCWRCHGSKVRVDPAKKGRLLPETWPNSGMSRENPDGSTGNCAACHESHIFSVVQARKPENCAVCHNSGGGDPQYQAYLQSRHGMTYFAQADRMNFDSPGWEAGKDYCAAPTCTTCHMGAAPGLKATHNINERMNWNNLLIKTSALAIKDKCGPVFKTDYPLPEPDPKNWDNMKKVCLACHAGTLIDNYKIQYMDEVRLFKKKWLDPGKHLYGLAVDVLQKMSTHKTIPPHKKEYTLYTHPVDYAWWSICDGNAKSVHTGAAMMSPGGVELGIGDVAATWYTCFIPAVESIIEEAKTVKNPSTQLQIALCHLEKAFNDIKTDPVYFGPWK